MIGEEHREAVPAAPGVTGGRTRESWVDVAKGLAIILVVAFHAVTFLGDVGHAGPWRQAVGALDSFRLPLFFTTAGLFAARAVGLGFRQLFRHRVANLLWLYLLWSTIWFVVFLVVPIPRPRELAPAVQYAVILVWPNESTWFVYALGIFFAVAWLLRRLPAWAQLLPALALSVVFGAGLVDSGNNALDKMGMYFVFFLFAVLAGSEIRQQAAAARLWLALALAVGYLALVLISFRLDLFGFPGVRFAVSCIAVMTGLAASVVMSRLRPFSVIGYLGTRTLPIYLVHFYPILIATVILDGAAPLPRPLDALLAPLLVVVATVFSLGVHRVTRRWTGLWSVPGSWVAPRPAERGGGGRPVDRIAR